MAKPPKPPTQPNQRTLIALERFYYNGRNVEMGEEFDAEERDVALLVHAHTPKATVVEVEPQSKAKAKAEAPEAKPQTYKTRDMKAED